MFVGNKRNAFICCFTNTLRSENKKIVLINHGSISVNKLLVIHDKGGVQ